GVLTFTWLVFFFQAEDGLRAGHVTGVQTCALPICHPVRQLVGGVLWIALNRPDAGNALTTPMRDQLADWMAEASADPAVRVVVRSEERRVGKEWRSRRSPERLRRCKDHRHRRSGAA